MKLNRVFAYLIGFAALASSIPIYLEYIYLLGFPDGFISELESAERKLAYLLIGINFILGLSFIYLGGLSAKNKIGKKLSAAVVFYFISLIIICLIDYYFRRHLANGTGG